jgi:glucose/arabinose dehydrogenase
VFLTAPAGDDRLFVIEQQGTIRIIEDETVLTTPFLDIRDLVLAGGERGLLSVAFHPNYAANGLFYVYYTDDGGDTQVARYTVSADPNVADPNSAEAILSVSQPFSNHNGGLLLFGPDDMLYIGLGDGGDANDPLNSGQDRSTLLGSILRIDVDGGTPYAIPSDNPFVGEAGVREEIWAYGLRNPWRFSIDVQSNFMWIGDVGQNSWEEINAVNVTNGGANFGWNIMEGAGCRESGCDTTGLGLVLPVLQWENPGTGCAAIGGHVYHGSLMPSLQGHYFFSDLCGGWLRSAFQQNGVIVEVFDWSVPQLSPLSFGVDANQELYIMTSDGFVYRVREVDLES